MYAKWLFQKTVAENLKHIDKRGKDSQQVQSSPQAQPSFGLNGANFLLFWEQNLFFGFALLCFREGTNCLRFFFILCSGGTPVVELSNLIHVQNQQIKQRKITQFSNLTKINVSSLGQGRANLMGVTGHIGCSFSAAGHIKKLQNEEVFFGKEVAFLGLVSPSTINPVTTPSHQTFRK